jgi:uncharacterized membrane protein YoaK (UPF0700 family)
MRTHLRDAWETVVPPVGSPDGPLPRLLILMTVVTGLVDSFSYLKLSRVFVANMTGNVIFLSFSLGGAAGFLWWGSLLAIATFSVGAFIGGRIRARHDTHRGRHLLVAAAGQSCIVLAAFVVALVLPRPYDDTALVILILLLGIGMGMQNATARALKVPDLNTTVLTLTITGISADSTPAGGSGSKLGRRLLSVLSLFLGGVAGALLIIRSGDAPWVLLIAVVLLGAITAAAATTRRSVAAWTHQR